jgi:hypothetical protein
LVNQGTNHLLARARSTVHHEHKDECTVALLHRPKVCAWCDAFSHCASQTPSVLAPFAANHSPEVTVQRLPDIDAEMRTNAYNNVTFRPLSLRLSTRVNTVFKSRGKYVPSNRGIAQSLGDIYFRVPQGSPMNFQLNGELQWVSANVGVQMHQVPNTGARTKGFSYATNRLPRGKSASLSSSGRLTPGVYRMHWFLTADQISRGSSKGASLDMDLKFGVCDVVVRGKVPPNPLDYKVTGLYGPYDDADDAAIAVEQVLREATDNDPEHREYGLHILKDLHDGKFYLTPPERSSDSDSLNLRPKFLPADYNRSRDRGIAGCQQVDLRFKYFASIHTHPAQRDNPLSDNVFSGGDFDQAIKEINRFDRIYLFPPDRCIRSFKAQRNDTLCGLDFLLRACAAGPQLPARPLASGLGSSYRVTATGSRLSLSHLMLAMMP